MKSIFTAVAAVAIAAAAPSTPAFAQDAAVAIAPGMTVVHDKTGDEVGTVAKLADGMVFISTDQHKDIPMPANAVLLHEGKVLFGMTKADLNAAVAADKAKAAASVALGKEVKDVNGAVVGKFEAMNDETITIRLTSGKVVRVPVDAVQGASTGAIALYNAADLEALGVELTPEQVAEAEAARAAEGEDADETEEKAADASEGEAAAGEGGTL
ncbi:hypothetical protein [Sphingomicrobium lutaoense]|uniref:PRC-barrel domain-containing protein n=1 Tax=Sphingomicrobium lutaoense TaxID=515949 RepID=A0A839Z2I4_9SPHN|nr:hypothetical protein [Sphingomicrobium lutaoense]MBB3763852.1 hypothetical protein [Sphingomicrobium lutaoense]